MTDTKSKPDTLPPGLYFIGDLTYLPLSEKDNEQYLWGEDGVLTSESGEQFAKFSIGNDGIYRDNDGFEYGVDAASIGVYPITSVAEVDTALGRGVEFFEEITVAFDEELGLVRFGEIEIELVDVALLGEPLTRPEGMSDLDWLRERAKAEDSAAQYELYEKLKGDPETHKEATKWMFAAARGGHSIAQYDAGCLRKYGEGDVVPHYPDAVKWLRLSAEQGDASAQYELGDSYQHGLGVWKDSEEAMKWFRLSAEQGDASAQAILLAQNEEDDPDQSRRLEELIRENQEHPIVRKIIRELIDAVLECGYTISVYDGEETVLSNSDNARKILEEMGHTDMDYLTIMDGNDEVGAVMFVYSDEPENVIADYGGDKEVENLVETIIEKYG